MLPQGPQLPAKRKREEDDDSHSPHASKSSREVSEQSDRGNHRVKARAIGPTLPPANLAELPPGPPEEDDSSSDDDDFGPALPSAPQSSSKSPPLQDSERTTTALQIPASAKPQRDDWMMVPPSESDWSSRVDPTKLRNRKFNTGKGAKGPSQARERGVDAKWTETAAEKVARLEREVMGIKFQGEERDTERQEKRNVAAIQKLRDHSEKARGPSLYQEHQGKTTKEKEDDPSARAFDREKDIAGGIKINHSQRKEMMKKAGDFGSRFSSGQFL